jgi:DNA polymerase III subunit gamma/tau
LDDLASLVAELRGTGAQQPAQASAADSRTSSTSTTSRPHAPPAAKKNDERRVTPLVAAKNTSTEPTVRRNDEAHAAKVPTASADEPAAETAPPESVLAQWQRAIANGGQAKPETPPPRVSRREQLAQIAEQPFVKRAMELFDVAPGQFRYTPPEADTNQ